MLGASNNSARSTVELSLNPLFRRDYSALYKAIAEAFASDPLESDGSNPPDLVEPLLEVRFSGRSPAQGPTLSIAGARCDP